VVAGTLLRVLPREPDVVDDDAVDLRAAVAVLRRRWKLPVAVMLLAVLGSLVFAAREPTRYRATSELLIPQDSGALVAGGSVVTGADRTRLLKDEVERFESAAVEAAVTKAYDGPLDPRDVQGAAGPTGSDILRATLTAGDRAQAATLLDRYTTTFLHVRSDQLADERQALTTKLQSQIDDLAVRIAKATGPLELTPLESQRAFYRSQLETLRGAGATSSSAARVLRPIHVSRHPISPSPLRDAGLALALGALVGLGLAFGVERFDERIRSTADLERVSDGVPLLAFVPHSGARQADDFVAARDDAGSPTAEAYRSLRAALKFAAVDRPVRVIQVTSPAAGEGKTTAVANLAVAIEQGGDRVAVVGCDLRRPTLHDRMGVRLQPGLTDVLLGDLTLDEALQPTTTGIVVVSAGSPAPNPTELLSSEATAAIVRALADQVDVVLLDCTPVLPVSDALVVARLADATVVVADARSTERTALHSALELLHQVGAPVVGIVLNGRPGPGDHGSGYTNAARASGRRGLRRTAAG
jgi:capsular exopolysaccharide synthesis family protein